MISIIEHIDYLLLHNDCVVVPGFGCFVAQSKPSWRKGDLFMPPVREIAFNTAISHNDGLLANSLTRKHCITFGAAVEMIADSVAAFHKQLDRGLELPFGSIGHITKGKEGNLVFTPRSHELAIGSFYGLKPFEFPLLSTLQASEDNIAHKPQQSKLQSFLSAKAVEVAASILIIVGLGMVFSSPIPVSHKNTQQAAMTITKVHKPKAHAIEANASKYTQQAQESEAVFSEGMPSDTNGKYHLVVNVFRSQEQALRFSQANESVIKSVVLKRGGIYRICVAQSNDYYELAKAMSKLPAQFKQSWIGE